MNVGMFHMPELRRAVASESPVGETLDELEAVTEDANLAVEIADALLRFAFLVEPVQAQNSAGTKMTARWAPDGTQGIVYEAFDRNDARYAPFQECADVFEAARVGLLAALEDEEPAALVRRMRTKGAVPYELPLDYSSLDARPLHSPGNLRVIAADEAVQRAARLRLLLLGREPATEDNLLDETEHDRLIGVFEGKLKIKAHLTDRMTTGLHKTNREKRWEAVEGSPQAATRRECLLAEWTLLGQLCAFEGFPSDARNWLAENDLLPPLAEGCARCPITRDPFSWTAFVQEIEDPVHGTSATHVGHLAPLKEGTTAGRHEASNVAWISSVGNRIQGNLSVADTIELLERIQQNYDTVGTVVVPSA